MITGNRFPVPKTPEERAEYVATEIERRGQQIGPYVRQLRSDFRALKSGQTIMECKTWTEFCTKVLNRTTRAVLYIASGGNPRSKRKPSNGDSVAGNVSRSTGKPSKDGFDWKKHWRNMPEFVQDDLTPFKTVHVHFDNQEHVAKFARLIGQKIMPQTRYVWYPKKEKEKFSDKNYVSREDETAKAAS